MLRRFQKIVGVGCFVNSYSPSLQFESLSFIYGENCYGKSTLCDILRSLAENYPEYLIIRKSVPDADNRSQRIQVCFSIPDQIKEQIFVFDQNGWSPALPDNLKILVFDTEFIHRNVFTGLTIDRKNHENITQFVLGESGVRTAEEIASLKSELGSLNRDLRQLELNLFDGIKDIPSFIALQVQETPQEINRQLESVAIDLQIQGKLVADQDQAIRRSEPTILDLSHDLGGFVDQVNESLRSTFQRAHQVATNQVQQHIQANTRGIPITGNWLYKGLSLIKGDTCPFCGQAFNERATMLLEMYRHFFDNAFNEFVDQTRDALDRYKKQISTFSCDNTLQRLQQNDIVLSLYPEIDQQKNFQQQRHELCTLSNKLQSNLQQWQTNYRVAIEVLSAKLEEKKEATYATVEPWDCTSIIPSFAELQQLAANYDAVIDSIRRSIQDFKASLNPVNINERITAIKNRQADLKIKQRRLDSTHACEQYVQLTQKKQNIEVKINNLRQKLEKEQRDFLNTYFNSIDAVFSRLGSKGFTISKKESRRGHMPTIQLSAYFRGVEITNDKLQAFFSESDRRALALSVFWAKIELLSPQEGQQTILVLDDPITSFDDGRIDRTIRLIESARPQLRQIIILSHYPRYLKTFFDRASPSTDIRLARIVKDEQGSKLEPAERADFIESDHQKMFSHIIDFIERKHTEDICRYLRIYLEEEVKARFRKQIYENRCPTQPFEKLIDALHNVDILEHDIRDEINQYRLSLNPDHHKWTERSHEDKICLATDVIDFIYSRLGTAFRKSRY